MIDLVQFLTDSRVCGVSATLETRHPVKTVAGSSETRMATANDVASVLMTLLSSQSEAKEGFTCTMHLNGVTRGLKEKRLLFEGTKGTLRVDLDALSVEFLSDQIDSNLHFGFEKLEGLPASYPIHAFSLGTILMARHLNELHRRLNDHKKRPRPESSPPALAPISCFPLATFEDGLQLQLVLDACYESSILGGTTVKLT